MFCFWSQPLRGWYRPPIKYSWGELLDLWSSKKAQVTYQTSVCEKTFLKRGFETEGVTLRVQRSWKVAQVVPKSNICAVKSPNVSISSSIHLSVAKVKRNGANGGVAVVGNAARKKKKKTEGKKWDKWQRREISLWSQPTNDRTLFSTSATESKARIAISIRISPFFPLLLWRVTNYLRGKRKRKTASDVIKFLSIPESLKKHKSKPEKYLIYLINSLWNYIKITWMCT